MKADGRGYLSRPDQYTRRFAAGCVSVTDMPFNVTKQRHPVNQQLCACFSLLSTTVPISCLAYRKLHHKAVPRFRTVRIFATRQCPRKRRIRWRFVCTINSGQSNKEVDRSKNLNTNLLAGYYVGKESVLQGVADDHQQTRHSSESTGDQQLVQR